MNWAEYQLCALKTAVYPKGFVGLVYTTLGLPDEIQEFNDSLHIKDQNKELGDICWYVACCAYEAGLSIENIEVLAIDLKDQLHNNPLLAIIQMQSSAGVICGIVKKYLRDEDYLKHKMSINKKAKVKYELASIIASIDCICKNSNKIPLENIMEMNLKKLKSRQDRGKLKGSGDVR